MRESEYVEERGLAHPFHHWISAGAPSLSRFLRQGGDFDFPNCGKNDEEF